MDSSLGSRNGRWPLLVAVAALSALLVQQSIQVWRADTLIGAQNANSILRGARLVPGDAEAWDRLGRFHQWDLENPEAGTAVRDYQRAVRELPLSPYYWMDLGSAYEQTGDIARAKNAFERAEAAYPISADVAWHYGNFLLRQQDITEGMKQIQRAVRTDPSLIPLTISRVWLASHNVNVLLDQVLPANPGAYFGALDFFQSIQNADAGLVVWKRLLSLGRPFPLTMTFPFLSELIQEDRADDARQVWLQATAAAGLHDDKLPASSLIWNGDFTQSFTRGGLGWCWNSPLGVSIDFDAPRLSVGGRSVRLDFSGGANTDLDAPYQYVPVEPNHSYHFHGELRTSGITTESGMRFSIIDPNHRGAVNVETENLTGTNPWTPADADVTTGAQTHFLLVRLRRPPSRLFDNKLDGTAWMADVSLIPAEPQPVPTKP